MSSDEDDLESEQDIRWIGKYVKEVLIEPEDADVRAIVSSSADFEEDERCGPTVQEEEEAAQHEEEEADEKDDDLVAPLPADDHVRHYLQTKRREVRDKMDELDREISSAKRGETCLRREDAAAIRAHRKRLELVRRIVRANVDAKFDRMCTGLVEERKRVIAFEMDPALQGHVRTVVLSRAHAFIEEKKTIITTFVTQLFAFSNQYVADLA